MDLKSIFESFNSEISFLPKKLLYFTMTFFKAIPLPTFRDSANSSAFSLHRVILIPSELSLTTNPNNEISSPVFEIILFKLSTVEIMPWSETTPFLF